MEKVNYLVEGLNSENIGYQVKEALERIEGVNGVCVDLGRGSVEVIYNDTAISEDIKDCIEKAGHPIN